jgi:hypothetical protein
VSAELEQGPPRGLSLGVNQNDASNRCMGRGRLGRSLLRSLYLCAERFDHVALSASRLVENLQSSATASVAPGTAQFRRGFLFLVAIGTPIVVGLFTRRLNEITN